MNTDAILVPTENITRFGRLAPYGAALVLLYVCMGALGAYLAYWDIQNSLERKPERIPYLIAMYASMELLFMLSAFRTWQATSLLHRLRTQPTAAGLDGALSRIRDMLQLFFVWLIFALACFMYFTLMPIY